MIEVCSEIFGMLRLAKRLHDGPFAETFHKACDCLSLDYDMSYEMAYDTIPLVFEFTHQDYNEVYDYNVWVFGDPCIDKFCRLCQEYEKRQGLSEDDDPYRAEVRRFIVQGFEFPGYGYDFTWYLSQEGRGRKRLVFFAGPEFYNLYDLPGGLLEIREGFEVLNRRLENELCGLGKTLQLPATEVENERKEAA